MLILETLKMMRGKISIGWTQGCSARNGAGFPVVPYSADAKCWCLVGSMTADRDMTLVGGSYKVRSQVTNVIMDLLRNRNEKPDPPIYNDAEGRTKEDILELIDEAISVVSVGGYS